MTDNKEVGELVEKSIINNAALELAFEAGKWEGQVELEEHFDREQYSQVIPEVFAAKKTAMPNDFASNGRTVRINLRSNEWRAGVRKSAKEYLDKAKTLINQPPSTGDDVVEKVARAICRQFAIETFINISIDLEKYVNEKWRIFIGQAKRAIGVFNV